MEQEGEVRTLLWQDGMDPGAAHTSRRPLARPRVDSPPQEACHCPSSAVSSSTGAGLGCGGLGVCPTPQCTGAFSREGQTSLSFTAWAPGEGEAGTLETKMPPAASLLHSHAQKESVGL